MELCRLIKEHFREVRELGERGCRGAGWQDGEGERRKDKGDQPHTGRRQPPR